MFARFFLENMPKFARLLPGSTDSWISRNLVQIGQSQFFTQSDHNSLKVLYLVTFTSRITFEIAAFNVNVRANKGKPGLLIN